MRTLMNKLLKLNEKYKNVSVEMMELYMKGEACHAEYLEEYYLALGVAKGLEMAMWAVLAEEKINEMTKY